MLSPGAVIIGGHANGLGILRSLATRGVRAAIVSTRPYDMAHHSRWVSERHALPRFHDDHDALVEFLEHHAQRWTGFTVFPTNDDAMTTLARHHERLSRYYRLPVQPWEVIAVLIDKDRMHALAEGVGLALPTCYGPAATLPVEAHERYPVLVKPIQHDRLISAFGAKLFLAHDRAQLRAAIAQLERAGLAGLVYDFVPGPDREIYVYCVYVDGHGEPSPGITVRKLRQNPPVIGGARAAEIAREEPALREATVALLRKAGFRGMAFAEFKRDPRRGRFVFIEVNGRAVQFNSILPPTGVDLVAMSWSDFGLGEAPLAHPTGWTGTWVDLQADVACWLRYRHLERIGLGEWLAPYRRPRRHAVWSASDPGPFLHQTALAVRGLLRGATRAARATR
jgi:D-aspartate ligase